MSAPTDDAATQATVLYVSIFGHPRFAQALRERAGVALVGLRDEADDAEAAPALGRAHVYQVSSGVHDVQRHWFVDDALLARMPRLLAVSTIGAGYDTVDVDACTRAGVLAVNQSGGGNAQAVAEYLLSTMLSLSKRLPAAERRMRRAPGVQRNEFVGRNVHGKTVGIVGFGHVGRRFAALCRGALSMRVLVHDRRRAAGVIEAAGCERAELPALLAGADFVAICCALNDETRGLIDAGAFARMQRHACLLNTSRGGIVDESALRDALAGERIAGAAIDVWDVEPPGPPHPLLAFDNVIATPHTAGATEESRVDAAERAARQVLDILDGMRPPRLLNPQALPVYAQRYRRVVGRAPSLTPADD